MRLDRLLWAYAHARTRRFADRAALERHQARGIEHFARCVLTRSPWFASYADQPIDAWPQMDKLAMLTHFDAMNTVGLKLDDVLTCALRAERSRNFSPMLGRYSVGLSSGTSGSRSVFVASPIERATWAGILLGKLLPRGLLHRERVALFLRANNRLYTTVRTPCLSFGFFDLFERFESLVARLDAFRPTIVVAPAQVLRALALAVRDGRLAARPARVISVAEVLEPIDRVLLAETFGRVDEVYQATEGFLGATCAHGTMHLNEDFVHVERRWLDDTRFVPIITDFTRATQPIVRYRLDDVLAVRRTPCPCDSPALAIEQIEGRCDDMLVLPGNDGAPRTVFADVCARALAQVLPLHADYRLTQIAPAALLLEVDAGTAGSGANELAACRQHLFGVLAKLGVATESLAWTLNALSPVRDFTQKRRRIVRRWEGR